MAGRPTWKSPGSRPIGGGAILRCSSEVERSGGGTGGSGMQEGSSSASSTHFQPPPPPPELPLTPFLQPPPALVCVCHFNIQYRTLKKNDFTALARLKLDFKSIKTCYFDRTKFKSPRDVCESRCVPGLFFSGTKTWFGIYARLSVGLPVQRRKSHSQITLHCSWVAKISVPET